MFTNVTSAGMCVIRLDFSFGNFFLQARLHLFFRSINYDEKDPFLCNACGFCKYAKFEYSLAVRPCCTVDPIENEEDRSKAILNVNSLLEKADIEYKKVNFRMSGLC